MKEENVTATECPHCGGWMLKICPDCDRPEFLAHINNKQPAPIEAPANYGEPWGKPVRDVDDFGNVRWLVGETGSFRDDTEALRATECWNACKGIADPVEALDMARADLEATAAVAEAFLAQFYAGKKISLERWVEDFKIRAHNARAALAKLTPA